MKKMIIGLLIAVGVLALGLYVFGVADLFLSGIEPEDGMNRTKAEVHLKRLYEKNQDEATRIEIANYHYFLGEFDKAKEVLEVIINEGSKNFNAHSLLAELYYLEGDYVTSEKMMLEQMKKHPMNFNVQVKTQARLMKIYYQTNQYNKVKDYWALGLVGAGDFVKWMGNFEGEPYQLEWDEAHKTTVEMLSIDPLPVIEASVNGEPMFFLFDTGGDTTIIDSRLMEKLNATSEQKMEGEFGGGMTSVMGLSKVDSIELNTLTIKNVPVMFLELSQFDGMLSADELDYFGLPEDFKVHGILGTKMMQQVLGSVDYVNGVFELRDKNIYNIADAISGASEFHSEFDFWLNEMHTLVARGTLNEHDVTYWLDSGYASEAGVLLDTLAYEDLGIEKPNLEFEEDAVSGGGKGFESGQRLNSEQAGLAGLIMDDVGVGLDPNMSMYWENGMIVEGMLSHHYLRNYCWTIDFDTMKMSLSR